MLEKRQSRLEQPLEEPHDELLTGAEFAEWYDKERTLIKTALGPVKSCCQYREV